MWVGSVVVAACNALGYDWVTAGGSGKRHPLLRRTKWYPSSRIDRNSFCGKGKHRMTAQPVELIGFDHDDALDEIFTGFGQIADYKTFLPKHLTDILRQQHPNVEMRSLELLETPNCDVGGMPSRENEEHVIVDTMKIPLELKVKLSTNGEDLHELRISLVVNIAAAPETPKITSDMFIRNHRIIS